MREHASRDASAALESGTNRSIPRRAGREGTCHVTHFRLAKTAACEYGGVRLDNNESDRQSSEQELGKAE